LPFVGYFFEQEHSLVIRHIKKTSRSKYGFQIKFRISGFCQREWRCHAKKKKILLEWQRQIELLHIFV